MMASNDEKLVYLATYPNKIKVLLKRFKKKFPNVIFRSVNDISSLAKNKISPDDMKLGGSKTYEEWVDWFLDRVDELWIWEDYEGVEYSKAMERGMKIKIYESGLPKPTKR